MKKIGDVMNEMGFNEKASDSVKEAFVKHLIKAATCVDIQTPSEKKIIRENPQKIVSFPKQLSFEFAEEQTQVSDKNKTGT